MSTLYWQILYNFYKKQLTTILWNGKICYISNIGGIYNENLLVISKWEREGVNTQL